MTLSFSASAACMEAHLGRGECVLCGVGGGRVGWEEEEGWGGRRRGGVGGGGGGVGWEEEGLGWEEEGGVGRKMR